MYRSILYIIKRRDHVTVFAVFSDDFFCLCVACGEALVNDGFIPLLASGLFDKVWIFGQATMPGRDTTPKQKGCVQVFIIFL